jgi:hypothetical protein
MKREPSIHITEKNLIKIFNELMPKGVDTVGLVKQILTQGRKYSLTKRNILVNSKKVEKKMDKLILSDLEQAQLFSQLLIMTRKKNKHRGVAIIKPGSKDWSSIKECTKLANDFCEEFELPQRQGYVEYINTAMKIMTGRFNYHLFNSKQQQICETYGAIKEIEADEEPEQTKRFVIIYDGIIRTKIGTSFDYEKFPIKYAYFIKARMEAERMGVSYEVWIKAQFDGLGWTNGIPEPTALVGDKAEERLKKYMYQNNISTNKTVKSNIDFAKIKKLNAKHNPNE